MDRSSIGRSFLTIGKSAEEALGDRTMTAHEEIQRLAASIIQKGSTATTPAQAYAQAVQTPHGVRLYNQHAPNVRGRQSGA